MPAVFRGNYVIKPDKGGSTSILNSYRFSQPTRALLEICLNSGMKALVLDFRICRRHTDSCVFHLVLAILPPFILSFDSLSQIARNFMPPSSYPPPLFQLSFCRYFCLLSFSLFTSFSEFSFIFRCPLFVFVHHTGSMTELLPVFLLRGVIAYIRSELEDNKFFSVFRPEMNEQRIFRKITLGIAM